MYAALINKTYMAKGRQIILFDTIEQAQMFVQNFFQYAIAASGAGSVFDVMAAQGNVDIEEFKLGKYDTDVQTVNFTDLDRK